METLFYNGSIITMEDETEPEAVIVKDGIIAFTGSFAEAKKLAGAETVYEDLNGQCLMPAFIDPHSHILTNGQMSLWADLSGCESYDDIIRTLKKYADEKKIGPEGAIIGFGYDHNFLKEGGQPDKRVLDKVSTAIPVMILHVSTHLACANSKALEMAGITADTKNPQGGVIGRLKDGKEPSGYLEETGMKLAQEILDKGLMPDMMTAFSGMQQNYIENGITTVQDGATKESDLNALKTAADLGCLKIDVAAYPLMPYHGVELLHKNRELFGTYKNHLKIGGYKLVLDGSPQGRSAWMSEPYLNGDPDYCGYPWMTDEEVNTFVKTAVEEKCQLLAHCNGDAAADQYISAYENALKETGCKEDLRPVMIHCQTVRNDQLDRMAKIKMIASFFIGHVFYWGDVHVKNFGPARGNHISPARAALDRNVKINFHQDTPVTQPNMLHSIWCAVNRLSRNGNVIGEDQKITVYEALKAVTIDAAYEYFEETSKGSIEAGKRADLVILSQSPLKVDPLDIRNIRVMETIKDGEVIFKR